MINKIKSFLSKGTIYKLAGIILSLAIFSVLVLNILAYISPNNFLTGVSKDSSNYKYYVTKRDFFNPILTFTYSTNPCGEPSREEFGYAVIRLEKQITGFYKLSKFSEGRASCKNYSKFLETIKTKDLSNQDQNPDSEKFLTEGVPIKENPDEKDIYLDKTGEGYYHPPRGQNAHSENLDDFRKLKVGMTNEEVLAIVGDGDIGTGSGGVTNTDGEIDYTIRKNGIRFIALGWNKYPNVYKDAKLQSVWVVYDDKSAKQIEIGKIR
jgi:hypothetical protein